VGALRFMGSATIVAIGLAIATTQLQPPATASEGPVAASATTVGAPLGRAPEPQPSLARATTAHPAPTPSGTPAPFTPVDASAAATQAAPPATTAAPSMAPAAPAAPVSPGVLHLTFDDGPDPAWTPALLDILARHQARATFFELGAKASAHPDLVAAVRAQGHTIGNHSWSHPEFTKIGPDAVRDQVARTDAALGTPPCVRPPFGSLTASIRGALEASGKHVVMWDVDTRDWSLPGAPAIAERIVAGARPGAIILLHDGGNDRSQTLAGVDHALGILAAAGWRFEPVPGC